VALIEVDVHRLAVGSDQEVGLVGRSANGEPNFRKEGRVDQLLQDREVLLRVLTARLVRVVFQTAVVLTAVLAVTAASILSDSMQYGAVYPALNGLLSGFDFIVFSKV
jgi:hypothetical protein